MRAVDAVAPDGAAWTVRVVWEPRWRALVRKIGGWRNDRGGDVRRIRTWLGDMAAGTDMDLVVLMALLAALGVGAVLFWWLLLPLLLIVLDLLVVLMLLVLAVAGRVLLRRPWTVVASGPGGREVVEHVVGWRAALRRRDEMAQSVRHGLGAASAGL